MERRAFGFAFLVAAACASHAPPVPADDNPLGTTLDVLPYPSSLYERADASSPTGVRVDLASGAMPLRDTGEAFDPTTLNLRTGWAAALTLLWAAPGGVDPTTLVGHEQIDQSVQPDASTVIVDMTTGDRIAHFAEVDANETADFDHQAVYLRPAQRLTGGHRYAVGIRTSVVARDGKPIARTPGFQAVLDDRAIGHARLDAARPRLRAAVDALEAAGVPRADLVVAWDFTVADDAAAIADPLAARDAMLAANGTLGANMTYAITSDLGTINGDPRIARRLEIDFTTAEIAAPGLDGFHRDGSGNVIAQGTMTAHAYVMVPPCATAATPAGILLYGHGFFGSLQELRDVEYLRDLSQHGCYVVAGTAWIGMTQDDLADAFMAINDLNLGTHYGERIWQGIANMIALEQLLRGPLAAQVLVDAQGRSVVDAGRLVYLGISQGSILGSTFVAYDPFVTRGVLHVGGANWSLMFERSNHWSVFGAPLKGSYGTKHLLDAVIMEQVLEMGLEIEDGATIAGIAVPGTPTKSYLLHASNGDAQVPNLSTELQARSLGLTLLTPSVRTPFGLAEGASSDRALVIVDEHPTPMPPDDNTTFNYDNDAHENPRRRDAIQQMMLDFFSTGIATNTCAGACDCSAGNCGALEQPMYGGT